MAIKKVVYLIQTPFTKRDNDRFGVDVFLNYNIEVEVLDLTYYMDKSVAKKYVNTDKNVYTYVKQMNTYSEIKNYINIINKDTIFISFIGESSINSLRVLNLLTKYQKCFGIILSGSLPEYNQENRIKDKIKSLTIKSILRKVGKALYLTFFNKFKYDFVISSGEKSLDLINQKYPDTQVINGHAFDYDLYLSNKEIGNVNKRKYAIFLDEFFPFHPDFIMYGLDYSSIADSYYKKLTSFFNYIEDNLKIDVIICAHPRSYYDDLPNYWQGRQYVVGETINLVKNSEFCMLHASTSLNFAILYNKPILFLTMDEIKSSNTQVLLERMVKELSACLVNLEENDLEINLEYDFKKYQQYKNKYIKLNNSLAKNNWEILYTFFKDK